MYQFEIDSLSKIDEVAEKFINITQEHKLFAFYGAMGSGKTTFIKAICKKMGVKEIVSSPTFTLVNEYTTNQKKLIYHFDFFRINTEEEVYDYGYEEYFFSNNICFMEWPEKIEHILPQETIKIEIKELENGKRLILIYV